MRNCKVVAALALAGSVFSTSADTYTIASGDVDDFTNKLEICNRARSGTIILSPGQYDVSKCSAVYWNTDGTEKHPDTHIAHDYITIRGETDNPRDVVVYGNGTKSIWYAYQGAIRNLTVSNGYVKSTSSLSGGGGIVTYSTGAKMSNVVVTCCVSEKGGGGVYHGSYTDCQIISNCTIKGAGGGASGASNSSARFVRCLLANNRSASQGGAAYNCAFDRCVISNNTAASGGGLYRGSTTAAYHGICEISNTLFIANRSTGAGGAVYDDASSGCYGCWFVSNEAPAGSGGALYLAHDETCVYRACVISNNSSKAGGGGVQCTAATFYDCDIAFNRAGNADTSSNVYGGGLEKGKAVRCRIFGNAAYTETSKGGYSGGAGDCELIDCQVFDNVAKSSGGAVRSVKGRGCVFSNNVTLADNATIYVPGSFSNCTFYDPSFTLNGDASFTDCRFLNHKPKITIEAGHNVLTSGTFNVRGYLVEGQIVATNCLFANNEVNYMFRNNKATTAISLVNCTVTSNRTNYIFDEFKMNNADYPIPAEVVNSIFVNNPTIAGIARDLSFNGDANRNVAFTNCLIGPVRSTKLPPLSEVNTVTNANPRFVMDGTADQYALKHSSPARGKGLVQDWMEGANDIRGEGYGRLRDEKGTGVPTVDIGCYQCWLDPLGLMLLLR